MKYLSYKRNFRLRKKRLMYALLCMAALFVLYYFLTREKQPEPEYPVVSVMPVQQQNVEIYGEYVGRIRAQQFVEVRARVEGFLEQMLFEEGTYVTRNQVLYTLTKVGEFFSSSYFRVVVILTVIVIAVYAFVWVCTILLGGSKGGKGRPGSRPRRPARPDTQR